MMSITKKWRPIQLLFLLFLLSISTGKAQRLEAWLEAADTAYFEKDYYSSFQYYDAALQYDSTLSKAWYYRGRSAYAFHAFGSALQSFDRLLDLDTIMAYPDVTFWMGKVYQTTGQFKKAVEFYEAFINDPGKSDQELIQQARKNVADSRWASTALLRSNNLDAPRNLGDKINSTDSDFGGIYAGDKLYFSSFRFLYEKDKRRPRRNLIQLMEVPVGAEDPIMISGPFNNPEKHTAYTTISAEEDRLYYCQCDFEKSAEIRCDIYLSKKDETGLWGTAQPLSINVPKYTSTQPALGIDPVSGKEVLYFSSDRPGGKGELDIWVGEVQENGDVNEVVNLEDLNTSMNDATPFYHALSQQFFFASEGYQTFGGYDIFMSYNNQGEWSDPQNIGLGTNSSYNEVHYAINAEGTRAIFSSDRPGSLFLDKEEEVCCYDLYEIDLERKIELEVYTYNALDSTPLLATNVQLDYLNANRLNTSDTITWDSIRSINSLSLKSEQKLDELGNKYNFTLEPYRLYSVLGERPYYQPDSQLVNLYNIDPKLESVRKDLYLTPDEINLRILTLDEDDGTDLLGCTVKIVRLQPPSTDSLLLSQETKEYTNVFERKIRPNYQYYIRASKPGYESRDFLLTPELIEQFGKDITIEIPLPRINFVDFLPLALYFDNAQPYDRNYSPTTTDNFEALCEKYAMQEEIFFNKFAELLSEDDRFDTEQYYNLFFSREVTGGLENLKLFVSKLLGYLERGNTLSIQVEGYASPLAGSLYNERLSQRRIKSLENFFYAYNDGILKSYIDNGQLEITEAPFGEGKVGAKIPQVLESYLASIGDNFNIKNSKDRRLSVYSLLACIERRVEIIEVKTNTNKNSEVEQSSN